MIGPSSGIGGGESPGPGSPGPIGSGAGPDKPVVLQAVSASSAAPSRNVRSGRPSELDAEDRSAANVCPSHSALHEHFIKRRVVRLWAQLVAVHPGRRAEIDKDNVGRRILGDTALRQ